MNVASNQTQPTDAQRKEWRGGSNTIHPVEHAAVTWKQRTAVLHTRRPLEHADRQIANDR